MSDLIDREILKKELIKRWNRNDDHDFSNKEVWEALENAPSAKPPPETCWGCNCPKMEDPKISEPKWIPVSERLPENMHRVLIAKRIIDEETVVGIGWYFGREKTWYSDDCMVEVDVVAWMKLPKNYENEVKE